MVKSRVKCFSNDSKKNIVISDNDNESKDTYECDKCGEILVPPKDRKDNETLYCQVCGESYIPGVDELKKNVDFYVPTNTQQDVQPAIMSLTSVDYNSNVRIQHEPDYQGGFKVLRDKGLRITSYNEYYPT